MSSSCPGRAKLLLAFAAIYVVWGSTYLAIRIGVAALPPALFAGLRWVLGGAAIALFAHLKGQALPRSAREWRIIGTVGLLLISGGNGLVVWAEQWVASNIAALIIASTALWIAAFGTLGRQGEHVGWRSRIGLSLGFAGVVLLLLPDASGFSRAQLVGELLIALAALSWAAGTIFARRSRPQTPTLMSASLQMVVGGTVMSAIGIALNEPSSWTWNWPGILSFAYLTVLGSIAFVSYVWLTHTTTPAKLGTYAYVNPAIAVVLGWWLLAEQLNVRQAAGTLVILTGVALVVAVDSRDLQRKTD